MPNTDVIKELAEHWDLQRLYSGDWWARLMELRVAARPLIEEASAKVLASTADPAKQEAERDRKAAYEALDRQMAGGYDEYQRWLAGQHAVRAMYPDG